MMCVGVSQSHMSVCICVFVCVIVYLYKSASVCVCRLIELRFYIPLFRNEVISEMLLPANLLASTEKVCACQ